MRLAARQSIERFAPRTTFSHFAVSSATSLPKSAGDPRDRRAAKMFELREHLWVLEVVIHEAVYLFDEFIRRALRNDQPEECTCLVNGHGVADGRHVRQFRQTLRASHPQGAQFSGF